MFGLSPTAAIACSYGNQNMHIISPISILHVFIIRTWLFRALNNKGFVILVASKLYYYEMRVTSIFRPNLEAGNQE